MGGGDEGDLQAEALLLAPLPCPWEKEVQVSVLRVGKSGVRLCHLLAPVTLGKLLNPQNLSSYLALEVERTPLRLPHRQGALQLVWGEEDLGLGLRLFWILGAGTFQAFSLCPPAALLQPGRGLACREGQCSHLSGPHLEHQVATAGVGWAQSWGGSGYECLRPSMTRSDVLKPQGYGGGLVSL